MNDSVNQWGPPVITALISWGLSVWYTKKKTSESLIASVVEGVIGRIEQVAESASLYYATAVDLETRSREIIIQHQVSSISREVSEICKRSCIDSGGNTPKASMIAFRKSVTGGAFRTSGRQPLPPDSHVYVSISRCRDELISALRSIQFGE